MTRVRSAFTILMIILACVVGLMSARYLNFEVRDLLMDKGDLNNSTLYRIGFYGHVILGIIALILGPWQFLPNWRNRNIKAHRRIGLAYVVVCITSGIFGLYIAQYASTGVVAQIGFSGLAIAWLVTTTRAFERVKNGDILSHKKWMIRSYALTFAAVTLRLYLGPSMALGVDFDVAYPIIAWACWVPNLIFAELVFVKPLGTDQFSGA